VSIGVGRKEEGYFFGSDETHRRRYILMRELEVVIDGGHLKLFWEEKIGKGA